MNLQELWIHFGVGKNARLIPVHELMAALGPTKSLALPMFHALTGCDTVSCFYGKGKKTAWAAWDSYPAASEAFIDITAVDTDISKATLSVLERFIIVTYDRTSDCTELDTARKNLFTKKSKSLDSLPPTSNAFLQHVKRAVLQAGHCWSHALEKQPAQIDPSKWGWFKDENRWLPLWITIPEVTQSCRELISCTCKKGCNTRCSCHKANLPCTALCHCDGECSRS
jgi:hypothetical protein